MAQIVSGNQIRLNNGQITTAQKGGWYDGQQFWNGSLSNPGQINSNSNQQGAGQAVSQQVIAQTNPNNVSFVNNERAQIGLTPAPQATNPTPVPVEQTINPQGLNFNASSAQPASIGNTAFPSGGTGGGETGGIGITQAPALNLPDLYLSLEKSSGIQDLQDQLTAAQHGFNDASSKINDNPFLSEADRTGRQQKLQDDFNNNTKSIQDQLAMKNADVQTQLDLATKQFDINSQTAKASMDQFNTLLSSGALDNASGNDIAQIAQQTGMSTSMIQSAIKASTAKNQQTQVVSFDDGTNQGFAVIDPKTGNIINKQVIAGSKILGTAQDKGTSGSGGKSSVANNKAEALQQLPLDFKQNKMTLGTAMGFYQQFGLSPQEIYNQYKVSGQYNPTPAQVKADQKRYNVK